MKLSLTLLARLLGRKFCRNEGHELKFKLQEEVVHTFVINYFIVWSGKQSLGRPPFQLAQEVNYSTNLKVGMMRILKTYLKAYSEALLLKN